MKWKVLLVAAGVAQAAQVIMSGSGWRDNGIRFRYETRVEPEIPGQRLEGFGAGGIVVTKRFHRYMEDTASKKYFGYDLEAEPAEGGKVRVIFHPLSLSKEALGLKQPESWSQIPTPRLPEPQLVASEMAVELFVHPVTGQKIVDHLYFNDNRFPIRVPSEQLRDFTLADVPLTLEKMKLTVNGKRVDLLGGGMSGEAVYFYLPGHGRYIMSLVPYPELGFHKLGEVRGNSLTIRFGSDTFVIDCAGPIAPGGGSFNLYVHHNLSWKPRGGTGNAPEWGASAARLLVKR